jgi:ribosomal protein S27E
VATSPQRAYRAACPNCGAPVDFLSAASASAVCSFCRSTLVRDGDALRRIGTSAELFDDHSPLQLGASGTRQGVAFTLAGRLQYRYAGGTWNEWHALLQNGKSAWLSEDNGAYVLAFEAPLPADAPNTEAKLTALQAGSRTLADGRAWDVASVLRAELLAAQGELPTAPRLQGEFTVVDLRNGVGEVATLDSIHAPQISWSVGRSCTLPELAMQGLKDSSEKTLSGRSLQCPSCGNNLQIKLSTTQSITCTQCSAVVDVSAGVGADMAHYQQQNAGDGSGAEPQLALGSTGTLRIAGELSPWQVVGYQERCDIPQSSEEETTFWREYLLYNRLLGFAFLVDSNEGWSWVKPLTGAPAVRGNQARWQNKDYTQRYAYNAKSTWVQGEFYWRLKSGERVRVVDYESTDGGKLSREEASGTTNREVTWSAGEALTAAEVADAFDIAPAARARLQRDAEPLAGGTVFSLRKLLVTVALILLVLALLQMCSRDTCDETRQTFGAASAEYQQCQRASASGGYRTGSGYGGGFGGSYGGNRSSGGGHK